MLRKRREADNEAARLAESQLRVSSGTGVCVGANVGANMSGQSFDRNRCWTSVGSVCVRLLLTHTRPPHPHHAPPHPHHY